MRMLLSFSLASMAVFVNREKIDEEEMKEGEGKGQGRGRKRSYHALHISLL